MLVIQYVYLYVCVCVCLPVDGIRLEHASEFKYLGCVLDELSTDEVECSRKVVSGRRIADAIRSG